MTTRRQPYSLGIETNAVNSLTNQTSKHIRDFLLCKLYNGKGVQAGQINMVVFHVNNWTTLDDKKTAVTN